ncbi:MULTISPECIES: HNH endonuclease signature motif containing protein [unclassified Arthrobacter]|uniref:HNH endonuclease signature motif containing protein n=1 Tax=unclassified Arthrobacter TaxID=235627 RepID=UPI0024DF3D38|nr:MULTISPECIES: HNH endonuclease signature motif containing protein [unclassified Arthrobacter]MCC9144408.1 HNH endonuclease [Arthrobacter sp. zg-Y919]MDK1275634.1 DUF222 domain-containing protein [Arthrobacter sp. zg.Y919]WIB02997.1 DUF222 domain-containing protein [Arthrobacter sp. zg-Y919]
MFCVAASDAPAAGTVLPAGLMGMLSLQAPEELDQEAVLQTLERLHALVCWAQAQQALTLFRLQELTAGNLSRCPHPDLAAQSTAAADADAPATDRNWNQDGNWVLRTTAAEVGALLSMTGLAAQRLVSDADLLCSRCPDTLAELEHGVLDYRRARTVVEQTAGLRLEDSKRLEAVLLPLAPGKTGPQFDRAARRMRERMFPATIPERHRAAEGERRVWLEDLPDGISVLSGFLPAAAAHGIFNGLTAFCARGEQKAGDPRTLDQLRADVFVSALTGQPTRSMAETDTEPGGSPGRLGNSPQDPPTGRGVRAEVMVLVSAESLLGLSDTPAELNGYGPVSADAARELLLNTGRWTGLLQDADGEILSVGRQRRIPPDLKRWLQARDGTCRFPGCSVAAGNCEIDHTRAWGDGGRTDHGNLAHLCKKHHRFKTVGLWKARQPVPGVVEWTSPMGRVYRTHALLHGRDFTGTDPTTYAVARSGQPGSNQPGISEPGSNQPGISEPRSSQPGSGQPGTMGVSAEPTEALPPF